MYSFLILLNHERKYSNSINCSKHEAFSMFQSQIQSNGKTVNNSELSNLVWAVTGGCDLVW